MTTEYYFSKIPKEYRGEGITPNFRPDYYFRFRLVESEKEVKFEDTCNRVVPISYSNLKEMKKTLKKLIKDIKGETWL